MSTVSPSPKIALASPPASSISCSISALRTTAASCSGVTPKRLARFGSAPSLSNRLTAPKSLWYAAQCSAEAEVSAEGADACCANAPGAIGAPANAAATANARRSLFTRTRNPPRTANDYASDTAPLLAHCSLP